MYIVKLMNNFFDYFMGGASAAIADGLSNSVNSDSPRSSGITLGGFDVMQVLDFVRTLYDEDEYEVVNAQYGKVKYTL